MNYIQIIFDETDEAQREMLIAVLSEHGAEGFEETANGLNAFFPVADFEQDELRAVLAGFGIPYHTATIAQQNWNQQWEDSFQPVSIGDFCRIRAQFHPAATPVQHDIIITPKMSFGTGHHATTRLMVEQMAAIPFSGTRVLDFGTGTGVLAILAEQLGAAEVLAIDNDEWSFNNAEENTAMNQCRDIRVQLGILDDVPADAPFEVILANINRHILLAGMERMYLLLQPGGTLLMSGLLAADADIVVAAAEAAGFSAPVVIPGNAGWIGIRCSR